MKSRISIYSLLLFFFFFACDRKKPTIVAPKRPKCWEVFIGDYKVYDTSNNLKYTMKIDHKSFVEKTGNVIDSLYINNYGNKFNMRSGYVCPTDSRSILKFWIPFPMFDKTAKRWSLSINDDDASTSIYENQFINDTIVLFYKLDNIAFFYPDSVPYLSENIKEIAVKQK